MQKIFNLIMLNPQFSFTVLSIILIVMGIIMFIKTHYTKKSRLLASVTIILSVIFFLSGIFLEYNGTKLELSDATTKFNIISSDNKFPSNNTKENSENEAISLEDSKSNITETVSEMSKTNSNYNNLDVALVIDCSVSMSTSDENKNALDAAKMFVNLCSAIDNANVVVLSFAGDTEIVASGNVGENRADICNKINNIKYNRTNTDILDALNTAQIELNNISKQDSQKMILLLSDGDIDVDDKTDEVKKGLDEKLKSETKFGYPVYTVGIKNEKNFDGTTLKNIANKTGGQYQLIDKNDMSNLCSMFGTILKNLFGLNADIDKNDIVSLSISPNDEESVTSEIIDYTDKCMMIVYGNPSKLDFYINENNDKPDFLGNGYAIFIIENTSKKQSKLSLYNKTQETLDINVDFIYIFDVQIDFSYPNKRLVGQKLDVTGEIVSEKKQMQNFSAYLIIQNEKEKYEPILLSKNDGKYFLDNTYILNQPGNYEFYILINNDSDSNKKLNIQRKTSICKLIVEEPSYQIVSSAKIDSGLEIKVALSDEAKQYLPSADSNLLNRYDVSVSCDKNKYTKFYVTDNIFETVIENYNGDSDQFPIYLKTELINTYNPIITSDTKYVKNEVANIDVSYNAVSAKDTIKKNSELRFNNNTYKIPYNECFDFNDSTNIELHTSTQSNNDKLVFDDKNQVIYLTVNELGESFSSIYASDNSGYRSKEVIINVKQNYIINFTFICNLLSLLMSFIQMLSSSFVRKKGKKDLTLSLNIYNRNGSSVFNTSIELKKKPIKIGNILEEENLSEDIKEFCSNFDNMKIYNRYKKSEPCIYIEGCKMRNYNGKHSDDIDILDDYSKEQLIIKIDEE